MKKSIIIILAILLGAIALRYSGTVINTIKTNKEMKNKPAPQVTVDEIDEHSIIRTFEAPGRVVSKYRVDVLARISGYLTKSYFKEGDYVAQGQTLFQIEPTEYDNAAKMAQANVANLKAQLTYAEKQLARAQELVGKDYIAKSQYDQMLSQRDALKAQLSSAEASYSDAQRILGYTMVKSPVNGRVGIINVTLGNYVTPSTGALTTINSTNPIYVTFPLDSSDYALLANSDGEFNSNRKVELFMPSGEKYNIEGVQDFQDNKVDQSTGTITMRATFENTNNILIPGEFLTVKLYANKPSNVPVVPQTAVQENQAGKFVYTIDEKDLPQLTYIKTNGQDGSYWIVAEGLKKGDRIVTDGLQKVAPGLPITIITAEEMEQIKLQEQAEAQKAQDAENEKKK
ncbi:efflux RND transporter periplasmic adaptor subunit [bacterium]|nr:efflux RND transporter periplasmic adaptor subunit [bacterium]